VGNIAGHRNRQAANGGSVIITKRKQPAYCHSLQQAIYGAILAWFFLEIS
jgi:hypothetical protein